MSQDGNEAPVEENTEEVNKDEPNKDDDKAPLVVAEKIPSVKSEHDKEEKTS